MGRLCTICTHPKRDQIDTALLLHIEPYRTLAARYRLTKQSLKRHESSHLRMSWEKSKELHAMLSAENLLDKLGQWHERMEQQYAHADEAGNIAGTVATARTGIQAIESYAKIGPLADIEQRLAALEADKTDDHDE
jgi:hypothetical protein